MLTKIQLAVDSNVIDISALSYSGADMYVLKAASGLDPAGIDVFVADRVGNGGVYKGRRVPKKEIVLRIGINPDYSHDDPVGSARDNLYSTLDSSLDGLIEIRLIDSVRETRIIQAVVEKFEAPVSNEEIEAQITFICPYPFFTEEADVTAAGASATYNVTYTGGVPVGFEFTLGSFANATPNTVRVTKSQTGEYIEFIGNTGTNYSFLFDTREGTRSIRQDVSSVITNALHLVQPGYTWLNLTSGLNTFVLTATTGTPIISSLTYRRTYWGL